MSNISELDLFRINDSLSNDENSTNEEIIENLRLCGVDEARAREAVAFRDAYFTNLAAKVVVGANGQLELASDARIALVARRT